MAGEDEKDESGRDETAPFQIKSLKIAVRKQIVAYAANNHMTVGEWVERAALAQIARERNDLVIPPASASQPPTVVPERPLERTIIPFDAAGLAQLLAVLGGPEGQIPKSLRGDVMASMRAMLRQSRGLKPLPLRSSPFKQKVIEG